jgi:signal peptidase I
MTEARAADSSIDRRERRVLILVLSLAIPLAVTLVFGLSVFRLFSIPSGSNLPTLRVGGYVVVSRASYGFSRYSFDSFELPITGRWPAWSPKRGDMIVFRLPRDHSKHWVKRVVGLAGEKIQMIGGRLSINSRVVPREPAPKMRDAYAYGRKVELDTYVERLPEGASYRIAEAEGDNGHYDNTPEFVVPPGHVFVLGDNRDNSIDSRDQSRLGIGFVPVELVIGRVIATF